MSGVLWDTFTGSAPYRDVFVRTLHPVVPGASGSGKLLGVFRPPCPGAGMKEDTMRVGELGRVYRRARSSSGRASRATACTSSRPAGWRSSARADGREVRLAELGEGDFFGEMALFEKDVRSATVRPLGEVRVLTVDKKMFLRKIHEDPSLAFRIMQRMSQRIRELDDQLTSLLTQSG